MKSIYVRYVHQRKLHNFNQIAKQHYLRSFIAGKCAFKNKMMVSWIVLIVLIYCLFSGWATIKDEE